MRILVIEDEKRLADSIKKGLTQDGFAVDVAYDGEKGYDFAVSETYDVIVLDRMLPILSGTEICSRLRKNHNHTPILMLTALSAVEDKVEGLNIGADDYLAKPFSFSELVARIRALSRRPNKSLLPKLAYKELELDPVQKTVFYQKKRIVLSKKEFALLEYFMRNQNTVLSKKQIIQNVWNFDDDILPNTVEVYIGYIRKKLGSAGTYISTEKGFGYRFGA
jgi:DNA-binding response OmpR family regulator